MWFYYLKYDKNKVKYEDVLNKVKTEKEEPKMKLCEDFEHDCAVEYCNIHGLWKGKK